MMMMVVVGGWVIMIMINHGLYKRGGSVEGGRGTIEIFEMWLLKLARVVSLALLGLLQAKRSEAKRAEGK